MIGCRNKKDDLKIKTFIFVFFYFLKSKLLRLRNHLITNQFQHFFFTNPFM